ncbi:MAG: 50S ribosomal protein L35 [Thermodesulfobacteriota bacterium]
MAKIKMKIKTNRGARKRFKVTGTGKIMHYKAYRSHLLTSKSAKRKRNLRQPALVDKRDLKNVRRLLPYMA